MKYVASLFLLGSMTSVSGVLVRQDGGGDTSTKASETMKNLIIFLKNLLDKSSNDLDVMIQANIDTMGDMKKTLGDKKEALEVATINLAATRDDLSDNTMKRKATSASLKDEKEDEESMTKTYTNENTQDKKTEGNLKAQKTTADTTIGGLKQMLDYVKDDPALDAVRQLVQNLISSRQQKQSELQLQIGDIQREMGEDTADYNTANNLAQKTISKLTTQEGQLRTKVGALAAEEKSGRADVANNKKDVKDYKQNMHETSVDDQDDENNLKNLIATLKVLIHDFTATSETTSFIQTAMAKHDPHAAKLALQSFASKYHNSEISKISANLQDDGCPWPIVNKALLQAQTTLNDDIQKTQKDKDAFSQSAQQLAAKSDKTCVERDLAQLQAEQASSKASGLKLDLDNEQSALETTESVYSTATKAHNEDNRKKNDELTESTESFKTVQFAIQTVRKRAGGGYGGSDGGNTGQKDATSTETSGTQAILGELKKVQDDLKKRMNVLQRHIEKQNQEQTKRTNTYEIAVKQHQTKINNLKSELESETQKAKANKDKQQANNMKLVNLNQQTHTLFANKKVTTQKATSMTAVHNPCPGSTTCGNLFAEKQATSDDSTCGPSKNAIDTHRDGQVTYMERAMTEKQQELDLLKVLTKDLKAQLQC